MAKKESNLIRRIGQDVRDEKLAAVRAHEEQERIQTEKWRENLRLLDAAFSNVASAMKSLRIDFILSGALPRVSRVSAEYGVNTRYAKPFDTNHAIKLSVWHPGRGTFEVFAELYPGIVQYRDFEYQQDFLADSPPNELQILIKGELLPSTAKPEQFRQVIYDLYRDWWNQLR